MIKNDWDTVLKDEYNKEYFKKLIKDIDNEYETKKIYPKKEDIFNAFKMTSYEDVKVVILGQDPYHGEGQAQGLSFSVNDTTKKPPSLVNIYKELESDLGIPIATSGSLIPWTKEGVLLINSVLTVEASKPASHKSIGWEIFTDEVIRIINNKDTPVVFVLWGNFAKSKKVLITNPIHNVIESPHPSPFSAYTGFFGSKPFSKTNDFLTSHGLTPINWKIN